MKMMNKRQQSRRQFLRTASMASMAGLTVSPFLLELNSVAAMAQQSGTSDYKALVCIFLSGGMRVDVSVAAKRRAQFDKSSKEVQDTLAEIEAIGVQVADLEEGVLAFPCKLEGATVFLSWQLGELTITSWVNENESIADRKPIDGRFGRIERERLN